MDEKRMTQIKGNRKLEVFGLWRMVLARGAELALSHPKLRL